MAKAKRKNMKYIVCYSGGHSSAICAIECVRKFGKENVILLNHDITGKVENTFVEHEDIKRFKIEVANYLGLNITYCNSTKYTTPLEVIQDFNIIHNISLHTAICTYHLKTKPFYEWLEKNYPSKPGIINENCRLVYGYDSYEKVRIQNRISSAFKQGYALELPCCWKNRTIYSTEEIGIQKPSVYNYRTHANCTGCLKAGIFSWYVTFCKNREIFDAYVEFENSCEYTILKQGSLKSFIDFFLYLKNQNVEPNENCKKQWKKWKKEFKIEQDDANLPCDCGI